MTFAGCASDPARGAPGDAPSEVAPAPDADTARLTARLRDYVYATYEVDQSRDEPALERLRKAREALSAAMADAGLATREQGLAGVVGALKDHFLTRGDQVFIPLGPEAAGILLVRVTERRAESGRQIAGRTIGWRAVVFDEVLIEDLEGWRARAAGGGAASTGPTERPASIPGAPMRPVARASGSALFVDRVAARRLAREVVIPRADQAPKSEALAAKGGALGVPEVKDLLRHRALAKEIPAGEAAVGRAIEHEEELRIAAYLACAPAKASALEDAAVAIETERRAILAAMTIGEPRYHLASALSARIAAPGSPQANGAEAALAAFAAKPLPAWTADELRAAASRALGAPK